MFIAELRKRAISECPIDGITEDLITGAVLCLLEYVPEAVAAGAVELLLGRPGFTGEVVFWRSLMARIPGTATELTTEPDAVLFGVDWVAVVEAKHGADFAPGQLDREFDVLLQVAAERRASHAVLVLLTSSAPYRVNSRWWGESELPLGDLPRRLLERCPRPAPLHWDRALRGEVNVTTKWLHWEDVLASVQRAADGIGVPASTARLLGHVREFLARHRLTRPRALGLRRFERQERVEAATLRDHRADALLARLTKRGVVPEGCVPVRFRRR